MLARIIILLHVMFVPFSYYLFISPHFITHMIVILLDDYVIVMWMFKAVLSLINSQAPTHKSLSPPYTSGNTEDTCMSVP